MGGSTLLNKATKDPIESLKELKEPTNENV